MIKDNGEHDGNQEPASNLTPEVLDSARPCGNVTRGCTRPIRDDVYTKLGIKQPQCPGTAKSREPQTAARSRTASGRNPHQGYAYDADHTCGTQKLSPRHKSIVFLIVNRSSEITLMVCYASGRVAFIYNG